MKKQKLITLISSLSPQKTLNYYWNYFYESQQINIYQNRWLKLKYLSLILSLIFASLQQLFFIIFNENLSEREHIILYNASYLMQKTNLYNIIWLAVGINSSLYFYLLYFKIDDNLSDFIRNILFTAQKERKRAGFPVEKFHGKDAISFVRKIAILIVNRMQLFNFIAGKF